VNFQVCRSGLGGNVPTAGLQEELYFVMDRPDGRPIYHAVDYEKKLPGPNSLVVLPLFGLRRLRAPDPVTRVAARQSVITRENALDQEHMA